MEFLIIGASCLAVSYLIRWYLRLANRSLRRAHGAWALVERHAYVLLQDRRLDPAVGDLIEGAVAHAGDGRLTRGFLVALIAKRRGRADSGLDDLLRSLNSEQEKQFLHLMVAVLYFDSLNSPIAGGILRKLLYWLAATAADRSAPVSRDAVAPAMSAMGRMCVAH